MERPRLLIHHAAMPQPTVSRYPLLVSLLLFAGGCSDGGSSSNPLTEGGGGIGTGAGGNGLAGASDTGGAASNGSGGSTNAGGAQGGVTGGTTGVGGQRTAASGGSGTGAAGGVGAGGRSASGGTSGAGGSGSGTGGAGGSGGSDPNAFKCKRGIAANKAPGAAFYPAIRWWYDWGVQGSGQGAGIEFVPMLRKNFGATLPGGSKFLLSFNEPNFQSQDNLTAAQAAADWPMVASKASPANLPIVGPGMNFCGPAANCNGTSPYQYLKDFFGACSSCKVDYVAVHWYNCDLPSLKDYLEPGGNLEGFEQFGKPIWLTEFSCDGNASVAQQEAYMKAAIPYLEANPHVYRYSWFSADPIPNARLINGDGSPTDLGKVYIGLDQTCK